MLLARAVRDVNRDGRTQKSVTDLVETVHLESIAYTTAVETVRKMTLVTGETEHALGVLLDGKINIVTKLAMSDCTVQTAEKHVDVVSGLTIVP